MMFYTSLLDDESSKMCTIVTPFGPFQYNRVLMGLVNSPAFVQSRMDARWHSGMCLIFHMESHGFKSQPDAPQEGLPGRKCPNGELLEFSCKGTV